MMVKDSQRTLQAHPSVQDLDIKYGGINIAKTQLHRSLINARPLHVPTASELAAGNPYRAGKGLRSTEAKDQRVTIVRGGTTGFGPGGAGGGPSPTRSHPAADLSPLHPNKSAAGPPPLQPPLAGPRSAVGSSGGSGIGCQVHRRPSQRVVTTLPHRRQPSLASTNFSFSASGCSAADSFSLYSCSCCHVKAPSTVASAATTAEPTAAELDAYEHMTSISQRIQGTDSVTSTAIATLRDELEAERRSRLAAQVELSSIRERQAALLGRLTDAQRAEVSAIAGGAASTEQPLRLPAVSGSGPSAGRASLTPSKGPAGTKPPVPEGEDDPSEVRRRKLRQIAFVELQLKQQQRNARRGTAKRLGEDLLTNAGAPLAADDDSVLK